MNGSGLLFELEWVTRMPQTNSNAWAAQPNQLYLIEKRRCSTAGRTNDSPGRQETWKTTKTMVKTLNNPRRNLGNQ
jgi:hypothetical protein